MKYLLCICVLFMSCKTAEQIAAEKAAKSEGARQAEMTHLQKTRQQLPCDTFRARTDTVIQFIKGEAVRVGDTIYVHDTAIIRIPTTKFVVDSAWVKQYQDSLASERYAGDLARQDGNEQAKRADKSEAQIGPIKDDRDFWRRSAVATWIAIALAVGGWASLKIFK